ncbi:hypothetical protein ABLA30_07065, partial [Xenorhabdus nematophila]|uniref:hypothetical protein n=1 Tax=Xenorhabdus nematophila TaxID=628 RepID=UPI0032B7FD1A
WLALHETFFHDRDTKLYEYFTLINAPLTAHPLHDSCGYSHGYEFLNSPDLMAYDDNSGIFINRNNYTFELKFRCTFCREIDSPPSWCKLH